MTFTLTDQWGHRNTSFQSTPLNSDPLPPSFPPYLLSLPLCTSLHPSSSPSSSSLSLPLPFSQVQLHQFSVTVTCPTGGHQVTTNIRYVAGNRLFTHTLWQRSSFYFLESLVLSHSSWKTLCTSVPLMERSLECTAALCFSWYTGVKYCLHCFLANFCWLCQLQHIINFVVNEVWQWYTVAMKLQHATICCMVRISTSISTL